MVDFILGDLILDTHVGSGSSILACKRLAFDFLGYENDPEMYQKTQKRISSFQQILF